MTIMTARIRFMILMKNIIPILIRQTTSLREAFEAKMTRGRVAPMQRCESITIIQSRNVFLSCFKMIFTIVPLSEIMSKEAITAAICQLVNEFHSSCPRICSTSSTMTFSVLFPTVIITNFESKVSYRAPEDSLSTGLFCSESQYM